MKSLIILQEAAPIVVEPPVLTRWDRYLLCGWTGHAITFVIALALLQMWRAFRGHSSQSGALALCLIPALITLIRAFQEARDLLLHFLSVKNTGHNTWSAQEGFEALCTCFYGSFATLGLVVLFVLLFSSAPQKTQR